jgi:hypothetical protein
MWLEAVLLRETFTSKYRASLVRWAWSYIRAAGLRGRKKGVMFGVKNRRSEGKIPLTSS